MDLKMDSNGTRAPLEMERIDVNEDKLKITAIQSSQPSATTNLEPSLRPTVTSSFQPITTQTSNSSLQPTATQTSTSLPQPEAIPTSKASVQKASNSNHDLANSNPVPSNPNPNSNPLIRPTSARSTSVEGLRHAYAGTTVVILEDHVRRVIDALIVKIEAKKAEIHPNLAEADDIARPRKGREPEPSPLTQRQQELLGALRHKPTFNPRWLLEQLEACDSSNGEFMTELQSACEEKGVALKSKIQYKTVYGKNGASAYQHAKLTHEKVSTNVRKGFVLGPFHRHEIPFEHIRVSGIFVIAKKSKGKYRLIFNLSAPKGMSVNEGYDMNVKVRYDGFKTAVRRLAQLKRAISKRLMLIKEDIDAFYNRIPVRPHDWWQLCFRWFDINKPLPDHPYTAKDQEMLYMYRVLPFGLRASVEIAHQISRAINFLYLHRDAGITPVLPKDKYTSVVYMDDYLVGAEDGYAIQAKKRMRLLLLSAGLPVSDDPRKQAEAMIGTTKDYVGIKINTIHMTASMDASKRKTLQEQITSTLGKERTGTSQFRSMVGLMSFCAQCVLHGRTFMRRLWSALRDAGDRNTLHLDYKVKLDLRWWLEVVNKWSGVSMLMRPEPLENPPMIISTDATPTGYGLAHVDRREMCYGTFPSWAADLHINCKELITAYAVLLLWPKLPRPYVYLFTDNEAAEYAMRPDLFTGSRSSPSAAFMVVLRELYAYEAINGTVVLPKRVSTKDNVLADALSRHDFPRIDQHLQSNHLPFFQTRKLPPAFHDLLRRMLQAQRSEKKRKGRKVSFAARPQVIRQRRD